MISSFKIDKTYSTARHKMDMNAYFIVHHPIKFMTFGQNNKNTHTHVMQDIQKQKIKNIILIT